MKLLVPTNFSKIADEALETAIDISKKISDGDVILIHYVKSKSNSILDISKLSGEMFDYYTKVKNRYLGMDIYAFVLNYESEADLYKQIESFNADMVVMGTQEVERYENERLVGENTKKLIKNLQIPIFCIRNKVKSLDFKRIVFASNLKDAQIEDFNTLAPIFKSFNIQVEILLIATPDRFITTENANRVFEKTLKMLNYKNVVFKLYNEVGIAEGIIGYVKNNTTDLLILPTEGRKGLNYFFKGSIAEIVLDELRIPAISLLE